MTSIEDKLAVEIDLVKYVSCRHNEINLLKSESFLTKEDKTKSLFQLLPRHMRRRTMGYLRKRLPRRIRMQAKIKPPTKVSKRPSRKYRRKRSNLLKEYERRKRGAKMWLETHIWHAKRFHMSESLYGYRMPVRFHCKCKRAVFKCLKDYACIHDESYYVCHQLDGQQSAIISGLSQFCSQSTGLTFGAVMNFEGQFEGRLTFYEANKFPYGCIGPVRFLWKPREESASSYSELRSLWIWSHPATHTQIEAEIIKVFDMKPVEFSDLENNSPAVKKMKMNDDNPSDEKMELEETRTSSGVYKSDLVKLTSLKDKLVRFKLVGPMSTAILSSVLKTVQSDDTNLSQDLEFQADIWEKIKSTTSSPKEITPASVLSLLVKDPRLLLPKKKSFNKVEAVNNQIACTPHQSDIGVELKNALRTRILSRTSLWNRDHIKSINKSKQSTHDINKLRSQFLLPGSDINSAVTEFSKIPILLVQSSLNNNMFSVKSGSLFSGWDIIMPNTWAMSFWLPFIHMGARAIGQNELNYLLFESGNLEFPNEFCDTPSSLAENQTLKKTLFTKFLARPASKRINFLKKGQLSPFICPWQSINKLNNLNKANTDFFILRNRRLISKLECLFFQKNLQIKMNGQFTADEMDLINNSYIGVRLVSVDKGTIERFSMIYTKKLLQTNDKLNKTFVNISVNKLITDQKKLHVATTNTTKPTLNKLIRSKFNRNSLLSDEGAFYEHEANMVGCEGHRTPVGCVQTGGYSLVSGKCSGNGYVLTRAVLELVRLKCEAWKENKRRFDPTIVEYMTPSSDVVKRARIKHFFIC